MAVVVEEQCIVAVVVVDIGKLAAETGMEDSVDSFELHC